MPKPEKLTLDNICSGAAAEVFNHELAKLLENIADPNTVAEKARTITLRFDFKPNMQRNVAEVNFACKTVLPGIATVKTSAFIAMEDGEMGLYKYDTRQGELPVISDVPEAPPSPKLATIGKAKA